MKYIVTFDIGTTAVKGVLVASNGEIIYSKSKTINTIYIDNYKEQDPNDWYNNFCEISKEILSCNISKEDILGIIMSGQMQDLILVDNNNEPVKNAILYSDGRANNEAEQILELIGANEVVESTGNNFNGTMPLAKLLWVKKNEPELFNKVYKLFISSKDYCVLRLTDKYITDYTSAATSGMMDIRKKCFNEDWLHELNIDCNILPNIYSCEEVAGEITEKASEESGYLVGTKVYVGIGDAGATTLASGIKESDEVNINLGTSGWVATISDNVVSELGVFNLVAANKNLYINVVPFLNAGNVHKWVAEVFGVDNIKKYEHIKELLVNRKIGSNNLLFLPYIVGERFPVMNDSIKGCYYGIAPETKKEDLVSAALEGVAFSIKQGLDVIACNSKKVTLIGGGAKEEIWCQILSDVLEKEIMVFTNTEFLPAVAIANLVCKKEKEISIDDGVKYYYPNKENMLIYRNQYEKFKGLYPRLKDI